MKKNKFKNSILPNTILLLIFIVGALPLLWLLFASFDNSALSSIQLPTDFTLENYRVILTDAKYQRGFLNSLIISGTQTIVVMICSVLAAYPLSRYEFKHGKKMTMALLFLTSLPITAIMVPVYQLFIMLKLVDSFFAVILFLSAASLPYGIWMTKNFLDGVPISMEESAWIDGASTMTGIRKVVLPLMIPGLFTVGVNTFIGSWGNFFVPHILLQSVAKLPASVNIYRLFGERGEILYGQLASYSIIYMVPTFILYFIAQKYMSEGFSMGGANKG